MNLFSSLTLGSPGCRLAAAASVRVEVDEAAVAAALPLTPGSAVSIPLHLHPTQVMRFQAHDA